MSVGISFCLADRSVCDFLCFVGLMSSFLMRSHFLNMFATRWQYLANIWCNVQGIGVKCFCLRGDFVFYLVRVLCVFVCNFFRVVLSCRQWLEGSWKRSCW